MADQSSETNAVSTGARTRRPKARRLAAHHVAFLDSLAATLAPRADSPPPEPAR